MVGRQNDRLGGSLSLLVVVAIAGCGGGGGSYDHSEAISQDIQIEGPQRIHHVANSATGFGHVIINDARCTRAAGTQSYTCIVHYTYQNSEGTYTYEVNVFATCNSGGKCRWHVGGGGTLVGGARVTVTAADRELWRRR